MSGLILYGANTSSSSRRVRWALNYKKLHYTYHALEDYTQQEESPFASEHFQRMNPLLRVPVLSIEGQALSESMAMLEFLEEAYPEIPLLPVSHFARARTREVCEVINATVHPPQSSSIIEYWRPQMKGPALRQMRRDWILHAMSKVQALLFKQSNFAVGKMFSLADILVLCMWLKGRELGCDIRDLPELQQHLEFCMSHAEIADACPIQMPEPD